jgi:hypothetical protein
MAGSYLHICDEGTGDFIGVDMLDNMGDAYEALEECFYMIRYLAGNNPIHLAAAANAARAEIKRARDEWRWPAGKADR